MLVRRAEIKDIEKINEQLLQVAMVHHYGRPDLFKAIYENAVARILPFFSNFVALNNLCVLSKKRI